MNLFLMAAAFGFGWVTIALARVVIATGYRLIRRARWKAWDGRSRGAEVGPSVRSDSAVASVLDRLSKQEGLGRFLASENGKLGSEVRSLEGQASQIRERLVRLEATVGDLDPDSTRSWRAEEQGARLRLEGKVRELLERVAGIERLREDTEHRVGDVIAPVYRITGRACVLSVPVPTGSETLRLFRLLRARIEGEERNLHRVAVSGLELSLSPSLSPVGHGIYTPLLRDGCVLPSGSQVEVTVRAYSDVGPRTLYLEWEAVS